MQYLFHFLLHQPDRWRRLRMSELSELYTTMMLKTFGLSLIGIFVPIYLYDVGFSILQILWFLFINYLIRIPISPVLAVLSARYGPKHLMRYSLLLTVIFLSLLLSIEVVAWPLWLLALIDGLSITMFYVGWHIDFSKIKKVKEFGKELEWIYISAKVAAASAPFIGGLIATVFNPQIAIGVALLTIALAGWPLMQTGEPIAKRRNYIISWHGLIGRWRDGWSFAAYGLDQTAAVVFWPFFVGLFIFASEVYLQLGIVTSIGAISAILVAHALGKLVDNHRGGLLLQYSTWLQAITNAIRSMANSFTSVIGINIFSEWFAVGIHMPYLKGMYAQADKAPDREGYIGIMEGVQNIGRSIFWGLAIILVTVMNNPETAFRLMFLVAAVATPLVMVHSFYILKRE